MSLNLNPWLALLLGIFIGWILEWLLEVWFFRRKRLEAQRRLAEVEAQLRTRNEEVRLARAQVHSLQTELAAKASVASAVVMTPAPTVEVEAAIAGESEGEAPLPAPVVEVLPPEVKVVEAVQAAGAEVEAETGELHAAAAVAVGLAGAAAGAILTHEPEVEAEVAEAGVAAALPEVALPDVALEGVEVEAQLPEVDLAGGLPRAEFMEAELPVVELKAEVPEAHLEAVEAPVSVSGAIATEPEVAAELPGAALAAGAVGLVAGALATGAEVELPAVEVEGAEGAIVVEPEVAAELPGAALAAEAAVELPAVEVEAAEGAVVVEPEVAAELPGAALAAEVAAELPAVEVEGAEARDNLTLIHGIGPKFAGQLAAAGISSFVALAGATPEQVQQAVTHPTWQKVDYAAWIAEAKVRVKQAETMGDHLLSIEGIGPVYAAKLRAAGITTFAQLADTDETRLAEIIQAPSWRRVSFSEWREQARLAAARDQAGLAELQSKPVPHRGRDNLDLIEGVSPSTVAALEAAGIATFAALAAATPEQLDQIVTGAGGRPGDYEAWIAEAGLRAAGKRVVRPKASEPCPQDLSRVEGIGSVYQAKLYAGGIGTYWQLSELTDAELAYILDVQDFQKVDLAGIKTDAAGLAEETGTAGRTWDGTPPDDFDLIEGIGEVYEGRLYDAGICTYEALAAASPEQLDSICAAPEFHKPDYEAWVATAKLFLRKRERGVKRLVACPQDLSKVKSVGTVYEQKLYTAGIGSYWELANRGESELRQILGLKDFQKVDVAGIQADAQRLAEETRSVGRGWTGAAPDDFELLEGVGETYEGRLYEAGICTFKALAEANVQRLTEICKAPAFRVPDYANWIAQAKVILTQRGR